MQLSKEKASDLLRTWKDKMGESPNTDVFVILRRIVRGVTSDEHEVADIVDQVSSLRSEESKRSFENRKVIGVLVLRPHRDEPKLSGRDLAAGAGVEARRDEMHDMMLEG